MGLDKIKIGVRIRKMREETFRESRLVFAERCGLSENHLGKLERGEILISVKTLDKICEKSGASTDYILYGKTDETKSTSRNAIEHFLDTSSEKEIDIYLKFISLMKILTK